VPKFNWWRVTGVGCVLLTLPVAVWAFVDWQKAHTARCAIVYTEKLNAIEAEGRRAGAEGMPPEACPYPPSKYMKEQEYHSAWKRGWQAGYRSRK